MLAAIGRIKKQKARDHYGIAVHALAITADARKSALEDVIDKHPKLPEELLNTNTAAETFSRVEGDCVAALQANGPS